MYVRTVDNQDLTFVVSGMLWQSSLVMKDLETNSLWSHLLGESMRGKHKGTQLETIPALLTDWETWRRTHPETTAMMMSRTIDGYTREMYRNLFLYVAGMSDGENSKAWTFNRLADHPLINDVFAGQAIVVVFQAASSTPFVFEREVDGETLTFVKKGDDIVDEESGSTWDLESGVATAGKLKGEQLKQRVAISSLKNAWRNFHPDTEFWKPVKEKETAEADVK